MGRGAMSGRRRLHPMAGRLAASVWAAAAIAYLVALAHSSQALTLRGDVEALVGLFNATGGLDGGWDRDDGWDTIRSGPLSDPCDDEWHGVTCSNEIINGGTDRRVRELRVGVNNLQGPIDAVAGLTELEVLYMHSNTLTGGIGAVASLSHLKLLYLFNNELTGGMEALSGLTELTHLYLYDNPLGGSLEPLAALTQLQRLHASNCGLSGGLDTIEGLTQLQQLFLSNNMLNGSLAPLAGLTQLDSLKADGNRLSGTLDAVAGLTGLQELAVNNNDLHGTLDAVEGLEQITALHLCCCNFTGGVDIVAGMTQLQQLSLHSNRLSGGIDAIASLPEILSLYLQNNELEGAIPGDVLASLAKLKHLNLGGNRFYAFQGHHPLPAGFRMFCTDDLPLVSLPEGLFDECKSSLTSVSMAGAAFPAECPAGQLDKIAPVSGQHYCERSQAAGLAAFFAATGGEDGSWIESSGWSANVSSAATACGGSNATVWFGLECVDDRVVTLQVSGNGLTGELPIAALASLSSLNYLFLHDNDMGGTLDGLGELTSLLQLYLSQNDITGGIESVGTLWNLRSLYLEGNDLSGPIDAVARLTNLQILIISTNDFMGDLEPVRGLTQLTHLYISHCQISGDIDALSGLTELKSVQLQMNDLSGGIDALANLEKLEYLAMDDNRLNGTLAPLSNLQQLTHFSLRRNEFVGGIEALAGLPGLRMVVLSENHLHGGVDAINDLSLLEQLHLDHNQLNGTVSGEALSGMTALLQLSLQGNAFTDISGHYPLPATLEVFTIAGLRLTSLPEDFFSLAVSNLVDVDVADVPFPAVCPVGQVDKDTPVSSVHYCERDQEEGLAGLFTATGGDDGLWSASGGWSADATDAAGVCDGNNGGPWFGVTCDTAGSRVVGIALPSNELTGVFPGDALASMSSLTFIDLSHNQLSGTIESLKILTLLTRLELHRNEDLSGGIDALAALTELTHLDLAVNDFSGGIDAVASMANLEYLHLSFNPLTGSIDAVSNLHQLSSLFIYHTQLSGGVRAVAELPKLVQLQLYNNDLSGSLDDLADGSGLSMLTHLMIHGNRFSGTIDAVSKFTALKELYLNRNDFTGSIGGVAGLTSLTRLDLAENEFTGGIDAVGQFPLLEVLDLHGNMLSGSMQVVSSLSKLAQLRLYENELDAGLDAVAGLEQLTILRIDDNKFHGTIPGAALSGLTAVTELNLGGNSFTGFDGHFPLPASLQLWSMADLPITSLPEGVFTLCAGTLTAVDMSGVSFPSVCPPGQVAATAPVSDQHYCERNQAAGLVAFFEATGGSDGVWASSDGWSSLVSDATNVCFGNDGAPWFGVQCDAVGTRVVGLSLHDHQLAGTFPAAALASLSSLEELTLSQNELTGAIIGIGVLTQLRVLSLYANALSGDIDDLRTLPKLTNLLLCCNALTGDVFVVAGKNDLEQLWLYQNDFYGTIAAVSGLTKLNQLRLHDNLFTGGIEAVADLVQLTELFLDDNAFTGPIDAVANLTQLRKLRLYGNQFDGGLEPLRGLVELTELIVSSNELSGSLDAVRDLTKLTNLEANRNGLTGTIDAIAGLTQLLRLKLCCNQLSGSLDPIASLSALGSLMLDDKFRGRVDVVSGLPQLEVLHLDTNELSGVVDPIMSLSALDRLTLHSNALSAVVPDGFEDWCDALSLCSYDDQQSPAVGIDRAFLMDLVGWAHNVSASPHPIAPWSTGTDVDALEDPCVAPWPGVTCDSRGQLRYLALPEAGVDVPLSSEGDPVSMPASILPLVGVRELRLTSTDNSVSWPAESVFALDDWLPPPSSRFTLTTVQLGTGGLADARIVGEADVWLSWKPANATTNDPSWRLGETPAQRVAFDPTSGVTVVTVDAANASGWPTGAFADLEVTLRTTLHAVESDFESSPPLPSDWPVAFWRVDTLPPTSAVVQGPAAYEPSRVVDLAFGASEPGCSFEYSMDAGLSWHAAGSSDSGGGNDGGVAEFAGVTAFDSVPPRVTPDPSPVLQLRDADGVDGWQVSIDGSEAWLDVARQDGGAIELFDLVPGTHSVTARARQAGTGIVDSEPVSYVWVVDPLAKPPPATALSISIVSGPVAVTPISRAEFELASNYDRTWFEYRLDGGAWRGATPRFVIGPVTTGNHILDVRAGSAEQGSGALATPATASWQWRYEPDGTGVRALLPSDGQFALVSRATDFAGNRGPTSTPPWRFEVDTVPPQTDAIPAADSAVWPSADDGRSGPAPHGNFEYALLDEQGVSFQVGAADGASGTAGCVDCVVTCVASQAAANSSLIVVPCGEVPAPSSPGNWSIAWFATDSLLDDGVITMHIASRDAAGNVDATPVLVDSVVDRTPPETLPAAVSTARRMVDGVAVVNSSDASIVASCEDSAGLGCAFSVDVPGIPNVTVAFMTRQEMSPNTAVCRARGLPDGTFTLVVAAWDALGHVDESPAQVPVVVDTTAPTSTLVWQRGGLGHVADRLQSGTAVRIDTLSATAATSSNGELMEGFYTCVDVIVADAVDPGSTAPLPASVVESVASCESPVPELLNASLPRAWVPPSSQRPDGLGTFSNVSISGLSSGVWRLSTWAVDAAGNKASSPAGVVASIDLRSPVVQVNADASPDDGSLITSSRTLSLDLRITEEGCLLETIVDDGAVSETVVHSDVIALPVALDDSAPDGLHRVTAVATDDAGNRGRDVLTWTWWLDTTPPAVDASAVAAVLRGLYGTAASAESASNDTAPTVSAACTGEAGANVSPLSSCHLSYSIDGGAETTVLTGTPVSLSAVAGGLLTEGPHVVTIGASDAVDNQALPSHVAWVVDTEAPVIGIVDPGRYVASESPVVSLWCEDRSTCNAAFRVIGSRLASCDGAPPSVSDDEDVPWTHISADEVSGTLDGTSVLRFSFLAALSGLGDGEQRVEVRGVDAVGQATVGISSATFYVDSAPPPAPTLLSTPPEFTNDKSWLWELRVDGELLVSESQPEDVTTVEWELADAETVIQPWQAMSIDDAAVSRGADASELRITVPTPEEGRYLMTVRARDAAGNTGPSATFAWRVALTDPTTELLHHPAEHSGVDFAHFVFTARLGGDAAEPASNITDALSVQVRLGTDTWSPASLGCRPDPSGADGVICEHRISNLEPASYVVVGKAVHAAGLEDREPVTFPWEVLLCGESEFEHIGDNGALTCLPCPRGADCGSEVRPNVTYAHIGALPGWWTSGSDADAYYACPQRSACLGGDTEGIRSRCAPGHTSRLCSLCEDGYYRRSDGCTPCPASAGESWAFVIGVAVALLVGAFVAFKMRPFMPMAMIKVTVSGVQILASASAVYSVPWPPQVAALLDALRVSLLEIMTLLRVSCASPMTFYASFTLTLIVFKGLAAAVVIGMAWNAVLRRRKLAAKQSRRAARQRRRSTLSVVAANITETSGTLRSGLDWWKVFQVLAMYLLLAYPGVSMKLLRVFSCLEIEGTFWLATDLRLQCYDATWGAFALWSGIMIVVYTVGLPVFITVVLWRYRDRLHEQETVRRLGFLYVEQGQHAYFGEALELIRKLLLSSLPLFFEPGSAMQVLYALVVSFAAAVLHAGLKPFKQQARAYWLQHLSLAATFSLFAMGLVYQTQGLDTESTAFVALTWSLLAVQAAFVATAVLLITHAVGSSVVDALRKKGLSRELADSGVLSEEPAANGGPGTLGWRSNPMHKPDALSRPPGASPSIEMTRL